MAELEANLEAENDRDFCIQIQRLVGEHCRPTLPGRDRQAILHALHLMNMIHLTMIISAEKQSITSVEIESAKMALMHEFLQLGRSR